MVMDISTGDEFENRADDRHDVKIKDEANDKIVTAMNSTDWTFSYCCKDRNTCDGLQGESKRCS